MSAIFTLKEKVMETGKEHPFQPEDLEQILKEESTTGEEDGWKLSKRTDFGEVWSKDTETSSLKLIKAFLNFPGIPVTDMVEMLYNLDVRQRWEKDATVELIEDQIDYRIIYWHFKMPTGVSDRDLIQYATCQKDEGRNLQYIMYKNATDDRKPEVSGVVRAKTILSSVILRPEEGNSTRMTVLVQTDMMGLIPSMVINMVATKVPLEWHNNLTKFYHQVYVKEKSS